MSNDTTVPKCDAAELSSYIRYFAPARITSTMQTSILARARIPVAGNTGKISLHGSGWGASMTRFKLVSKILGPFGVNGFNRMEVIRLPGRFIRNRHGDKRSSLRVGISIHIHAHYIGTEIRFTLWRNQHNS